MAVHSLWSVSSPSPPMWHIYTALCTAKHSTRYISIIYSGQEVSKQLQLVLATLTETTELQLVMHTHKYELHTVYLVVWPVMQKKWPQAKNYQYSFFCKYSQYRYTLAWTIFSIQHWQAWRGGSQVTVRATIGYRCDITTSIREPAKR